MWVCEGHSMLSLTALLCAPTSSASRNPLDELALSPTCQPSCLLLTPPSLCLMDTQQLRFNLPNHIPLWSQISNPCLQLSCFPGPIAVPQNLPISVTQPGPQPHPGLHLAGLLTNRYGCSGNYWQGCNAEVQHKCPESKLLSI